MACGLALVDDDPDFAGTLAQLLEEEGFGVHVFETPEEAFEWMLRGGRARIVLLDLRTPGMSAQRFRALLMSTPELRKVAVIVISGDPAIYEIATAVGTKDAFTKPVDLDRLVEAIRRHCREDEALSATS
jgi:DNA-binding NtrC family response regulator